MPDFEIEERHWSQGLTRVSGVDEAGRGPLAGPVVAAAVVLDPDAMKDAPWPLLNDSKKMSEPARVALFEAITQTGDVGVGIVGVEEIDLLNILGATMKAMTEAVANLTSPVDFVLVDGNRLPLLTYPADAVVKGDARSLSIAAASVIAKVTRDRIMTSLAEEFPGYGWETNAGYGTKAHLGALATLGPTPHHRRSFAPVRAALGTD